MLTGIIPNEKKEEAMKKLRETRGFTLIEVIVVIAVVAILAAILTPSVVKNIDDSKIARAKNEVQVIGAAMTSFYKDLGRWPTSNGSTGNPDSLYMLNGPGNTPSYDNSVNNHANWWTYYKDTNTYGDLMENHLIKNDPKGGSVDYPTTGEYRWHGPYLSEIKADPWGSYYASNVRYFYSGQPDAVFVWSPGPDRQADTQFDQDVTNSPTLGDDDIGMRLK